MTNPSVKAVLDALHSMSMVDIVKAHPDAYAISEIFVRMLMDNLPPQDHAIALAIALGVIHASYTTETCKADEEGGFVTTEDRMTIFSTLHKIAYEDGLKIIGLIADHPTIQMKKGVH